MIKYRDNSEKVSFTWNTQIHVLEVGLNQNHYADAPESGEILNPAVSSTAGHCPLQCWYENSAFGLHVCNGWNFCVVVLFRENIGLIVVILTAFMISVVFVL